MPGKKKRTGQEQEQNTLVLVIFRRDEYGYPKGSQCRTSYCLKKDVDPFVMNILQKFRQNNLHGEMASTLMQLLFAPDKFWTGERTVHKCLLSWWDEELHRVLVSLYKQEDQKAAHAAFLQLQNEIAAKYRRGWKTDAMIPHSSFSTCEIYDFSWLPGMCGRLF